MLNILKKSNKSHARCTELITPHGTIQTPFFMTVATTGSVKTLDCEKMKRLNSQILLSNTYHLYLRPGTELITKAGGLHEFMNWSRPVLTDSGGYQVFSLSKMRKINEEGAFFSSHIDGSKHMLSPEKSMEIQLKLGSDMIMVLDECPPHTESKKYIEDSLELTTRWAQRCKDYFEENNEQFRYNNLSKPFLFGIVQGGMHMDLRERSLDQLSKIGFDGMAIGGVSVGEPTEEMRKIVSSIGPNMPSEMPRYVMGVGFPDEIVHCIKQGIDMFDCVIPTRHARHGSLFVFKDRNVIGDGDFYQMLNIKNQEFKEDFSPIDSKCGCLTCTYYTRAYLRYLFKIKEMLAYRLATIHNIHFYLEMMKKIRERIRNDEF